MDNYVKLRVVGKGSYGEVWLVKHRRDKKQYVLKKLDVHNASKRERHAAEQEAKLLSRLKHPNIVSYKDSFETDEGQLYIAMGYCEGGDLYTRLKEQKGSVLEERQIVEWFVQIAMALQYMHERNILHRDLKTQNIFLTKSKIIKVGDLGIARVLDHSSDMATTLIGTPYYMSPELFSNKPYNHKSDVWALGCCVYEMTTLKHAFNAKDMNALVYKILMGKMPAMPKQYSGELVTLIKAMLNHNPDRRPSVSRILRDKYIKRNIALFLESSRKEKRPVRSSQGDRSSDARPRHDEPDGDRSRVRKPRSSPAIEVKDNDSEPLQIGPELESITEEDTAGTGGSQKSHQSDHQFSSPTHSPMDNRQDNRAFKPKGITNPIVISIDTGSIGNCSNDGDVKRDVSPHQKNRGSRATRSSLEKLNNSDERSRSNSGDSRPSSAGSRRNSREEKGLPSSASSPSLSAKDRSPEGRRNSKSVLDNPRLVAKPRPLPNREPVTPRESNKEPKASRSSRGSGNGVESVYGSGSSYSQDGAISARVDLETPRTNLSARERRRERKDRETPREPVSARSVDLNIQRRSIEPGPQLTRPSGSKSEDYSKNDASRQLRPYLRHDVASKLTEKSSRTDEQKLRMRQPSIDNDSSESSAEEEDQAEQAQQKENERNARPPISKPSLIVNAPQTGSKIASNYGNSLRPGRDPLKALHPSPNPSTPVNDSNDDEEENGKQRDIGNLISVLNTTLQMNKDKEEEEEEEDIFPDDVELEPPGGTKFIHRAPKILAMHEEPSSDADVPVMEVESVKGSPNKFNVNISSPGNAGIRTLTTTGRLWARITDLRKDCIRGLGVEKIKRAYDILDNFDAEELEPQLIQLFGKRDFDQYAGKIWQLKFCEEAAFGLV